MYFSIKYCYSDILLNKHKLHLKPFVYCNHTCYCVRMVTLCNVSVTLLKQILDVPPRSDSTELSEAVSIGLIHLLTSLYEPVCSIRYMLACAYSKDSNQSAHLHSLIRVLVFSLNKRSTLGYS